ncbi:hypothetical protein [Ethanoligenens harbinense]|uniref:Uncharacterized protein n=1 Tax=Ethanoligenens harbinense (strain DSM 18485 / JCM 12961 / CGMCC 1.5033 / YUAN-3) TaxID=663278 RepID=E6U9N2_ETHHY|nr:hypothetical protein [Ethanoligenens harbinense]ADU27318.1 hypothetical protein Ethha_1793 [Ethanoligenens harbinense YUAN-3]AVQ96383.1 hypothetical protein CXQ68_09195 [Ethanoligenens harbinense YUAN-3]AYF39041.1 hypothetical protein CXP51_09065 [Ethanoligenens harbinense]AYF41867.1 hypothetical protein CN246_09635 [Ethanoligenens harbinense]QCN92624.1 hypothetical protein DRA42_09225 [Ethanoligenens harbinense]
MEHARKRRFIPIHGAASWQHHGGVDFLVTSQFCGWESIITRLQELMVAELEDGEFDDSDGDRLPDGEDTDTLSSEKP